MSSKSRGYSPSVVLLAFVLGALVMGAFNVLTEPAPSVSAPKLEVNVYRRNMIIECLHGTTQTPRATPNPEMLNACEKSAVRIFPDDMIEGN